MSVKNVIIRLLIRGRLWSMQQPIGLKKIMLAQLMVALLGLKSRGALIGMFKIGIHKLAKSSRDARL